MTRIFSLPLTLMGRFSAVTCPFLFFRDAEFKSTLENSALFTLKADFPLKSMGRRCHMEMDVELDIKFHVKIRRVNVRCPQSLIDVKM